MSYSIYIGELEKSQDSDPLTSYHVNVITLPVAPVFSGDEFTGQSNSRYPGYSQWHDFLKTANLPVSFLVEDHPGYRIIIAADQSVVNTALLNWRESHRQDPGFDSGQDPILARLMWMKFWIDWTLENCHDPGVYNS